MVREGSHGWVPRSRAERNASARRAQASADGAISKLTAQLTEAKKELSDAKVQLSGLVNALGDPELFGRLALIAPVLWAKLERLPIEKLAIARRNAAAHNFGTPVSVLAAASQAELNRIQRSSTPSICDGQAAPFSWNAEAPEFRPCQVESERPAAETLVHAPLFQPLVPALAEGALRCTCGAMVLSSADSYFPAECPAAQEQKEEPLAV